jgi:hypothetical protein
MASQRLFREASFRTQTADRARSQDSLEEHGIFSDELCMKQIGGFWPCREAPAGTCSAAHPMHRCPCGLRAHLLYHPLSSCLTSILSRFPLYSRFPSFPDDTTMSPPNGHVTLPVHIPCTTASRDSYLHRDLLSTTNATAFATLAYSTLLPCLTPFLSWTTRLTSLT